MMDDARNEQQKENRGLEKQKFQNTCSCYYVII